MAKWLRLYAGLFLWALMTGCAERSLQQDPSWKLVFITDLHMVVGEWEGLVRKEHGTLPEQSIRLMILERGTYLIAGQSASRVAVGSGDLEIHNGRLTEDTEGRGLTFALYDHRGKSVIVLDATNPETGERYHVEFTKAQ